MKKKCFLLYSGTVVSYNVIKGLFIFFCQAVTEKEDLYAGTDFAGGGYASQTVLGAVSAGVGQFGYSISVYVYRNGYFPDEPYLFYADDCFRAYLPYNLRIPGTASVDDDANIRSYGRQRFRQYV